MIGTTEIILIIVILIIILFGGKNASKITKKFVKTIKEIKNFRI
tara:strand:+ start:261 stop:392 length:132 start_codon:yes stop_codon:yes gene_type:complete